MVPCVLFFWLPAIDTAARESDYGGYLCNDLQLTAGAPYTFPDEFSRYELRFALHADLKPNDRVRIFSEAWLRGIWEFPAEYTDADWSAANPFSYENLFPLEIELRETYADLYSFIFQNLDLRIGRQRIAWGTAEQVSVIDNLNPDDLYNFWEFGSHTASEALKLNWYGSFFTVESVYIPVFRPALLHDDISSFMNSAIPDLSPLELSQLTVNFLLPGKALMENAALGFRLNMSFIGWDMAVSYIYGRQDFPAPTEITIDWDTPGVSVDVTVKNEYPRHHIVGIDLAGEFIGLGIWGEAALFLPDYTTVTDKTLIGFGLSSDKAKPYLKASAGLDYTFPFGLYTNIQYVHGLSFENSRGMLEDYFLFGLEWKLFNEGLKIGPLGLALEVDDFGDFINSWALVFNPELNIYPMDSVELGIGFRWVDGRNGTTFGLNNGANELYLKGKFSF